MFTHAFDKLNIGREKLVPFTGPLIGFLREKNILSRAIVIPMMDIKAPPPNYHNDQLLGLTLPLNLQCDSRLTKL